MGASLDRSPAMYINGYSATPNGLSEWTRLNILNPGQTGLHFAADIFKCILLTECCFILDKILLKFIPQDCINNKPALN